MGGGERGAYFVRYEELSVEGGGGLKEEGLSGMGAGFMRYTGEFP